MKIIFYPEGLRKDKNYPEKTLSSLKKEHSDLYSKVHLVLQKIRNGDRRTLSDLGKQKIYKPLGEGIFEFRIPPRAKGGVVRVYFTFSRTEKDTIIILDIECKKKKKGKIGKALERKREYDR